jgi:glutamine amidotransferase
MTGIIDYGAGNIFSLTAALNRLNIPYRMVGNPAELTDFDRYIIPGVGHAGAAMVKLQESGMIPEIKQLDKPVLGICVGMQLLTAFSEEGNSDLLDIVPLKTLSFSKRIHQKVPHTGWNEVAIEKTNPLFDKISNQTYFYFVHSYFIEYDPRYTIASSDYEISFSAAIRNRNFYGVQFHPEKSGAAGEHVLLNFSRI